ncbi:putative glycosyl transferase [Chondrus crispus]|uniref:Putative glycosyl transferase n=1 Tax=Chondrus crispus TaxID=2769 RepID=R7Q6Y0_CHOCR|nr:putative glycosyl transferase [Chondrus crispus]CDF33573.1 putative glycosyl transferase [Chondrus crispus]|eukprot:XP_005713376.1 putative glycosyl transferase [Chondrus crispus]
MPKPTTAVVRISRHLRNISRNVWRLSSSLTLPTTSSTKSAPRSRATSPIARGVCIVLVLILFATFSFPHIRRSAHFASQDSHHPLAPGFEHPSLASKTNPLSGDRPFRLVLVIPAFTGLPPPPNPAFSAPSTLDVPPDSKLYSSRALSLLITSLVEAHYDNEPVSLSLVLAPEPNSTTYEARYLQCQDVVWPHGDKTLHNATTGGLFELGVSSWSPSRGDTEKVLIVDASRALPFVPQFYRYLKSVRRRYMSSAADIAGFTLEPVLIRRRESVLGRSTGSYTSAFVGEGEAGDEVFLYHNLPFVAAFSPVDSEVWRAFQRWFAAHRAEWFLWPTVVGAKDKKDSAWGQYRGTARAHWTLWFSRFCAEYNLFTVYPRRHRPEPLPPVGRVSALPPLSRFNFDGKKVEKKEQISAANLEKIVELGRRQGGSVSLTVVNTAFVETARSWICNVDAAQIRPPGVVWITTDDTAYNALRDVSNSQTVRMTEFRGGQARAGTSYGSPGYWLLMLERTQLIRAILERGIGVFAFETDQIWLRDPVPFVQRLIHSGDEVDVVGTLDTRHEIGGNFLYLNPTLATRRVWREVSHRFEKAYRSSKMEGHTSRVRRYMENDQSILTKLIFFDEQFKSRNPVVFRALDTELFVDGRWYDTKEKHYTSARSRSPIVVNNNFLIGIDKKKKRAAENGHWFLKSDGKTCDEILVKRAVSDNEQRAPSLAGFGTTDGGMAPEKDSEEEESAASDSKDDSLAAMRSARIEGADVEAGLDAAMMAIGKELAT